MVKKQLCFEIHFPRRDTFYSNTFNSNTLHSNTLSIFDSDIFQLRTFYAKTFFKYQKSLFRIKRFPSHFRFANFFYNSGLNLANSQNFDVPTRGSPHYSIQ